MFMMFIAALGGEMDDKDEARRYCNRGRMLSQPFRMPFSRTVERSLSFMPCWPIRLFISVPCSRSSFEMWKFPSRTASVKGVTLLKSLVSTSSCSYPRSLFVKKRSGSLCSVTRCNHVVLVSYSVPFDLQVENVAVGSAPAASKALKMDLGPSRVD